MSTQAKELISKAQQISAAGASVTRTEEIEARLTEIKHEERCQRGLLPKSEMSPLFLEWLQREVRRFEADEVPLILSTLSAGRTPHLRNERDVFRLLVFALLPDLERLLPKAIARLKYQAGPGRFERATVLKRLSGERAELLAEHERLVDEVNEATAGTITLRHLPDNQRRRDHEAAQRGLQEQRRQRQEEASRQLEERRAKE